VIVGNTVGIDVTFKLWSVVRLRFSRVGGTACTSRGVLGLGVPQSLRLSIVRQRGMLTSKKRHDCAIITDGGMSRGGDVCKALACGADAVMVAVHLPKRTKRLAEGTTGDGHAARQSSARTRIIGGSHRLAKTDPVWSAEVDDGSQNLVGAVTTCMGNVGARNIAEFQQNRDYHRASIKTEGKLFQTVQALEWNELTF